MFGGRTSPRTFSSSHELSTGGPQEKSSLSPDWDWAVVAGAVHLAAWVMGDFRNAIHCFRSFLLSPGSCLNFSVADQILSPKDMLVPESVTLLGNRVFADIMKLRSHIGLDCAFTASGCCSYKKNM